MISDVVVVAVVTNLATIATVLITALVSGRKVEKTTRAVYDTSDAHREELLSQRATIDATHRLVNSEHTVLLRTVARLERRHATDNPNDRNAQLAAEEAEAALAANLRLQIPEDG